MANNQVFESDGSNINFYGGNFNQGNTAQTAQGMRLNTKSPGRSNGAPGGNTNGNFAPMTYGAAAAK